MYSGQICNKYTYKMGKAHYENIISTYVDICFYADRLWWWR